jgi:MFS family permease
MMRAMEKAVDPPISRRELLLAVYLPTAFLAFGQGILLVTIPVFAASLGITATLISLVTAAAAIGTLVTDVPAGLVLQRFGLRRAMLVGAAMVVIGTGSLALPITVETMVIFRIFAGIGTALWGLSRHAFIAQSIPIAERGRAIAMFGGINRVGTFGGPILGGLVATGAGFRISFVAAAVLGLFAFVAAFRFIPDDAHLVLQRKANARVRWGIVRETMRLHASDLTAAGIAQLFAQMIRQGRQLLIPLVGVQQIGLTAAEVGTVITISAIVDMAMFFPAGFVMDRFGRKFSSVPSFAVMGLGILLIPFAHSFWGLAGAGVVIGLGNGLGSGSMMTLGADLAPPGATGEFLGIWRLIGDTGGVIGPISVGIIADGLGLTKGAYALAGAGFVSSLILLFLVKETRIVDEPPPISDVVINSS